MSNSLTEVLKLPSRPPSRSASSGLNSPLISVMTAPKERDIDVLGYFPKEESDHVATLIDGLLAGIRESTLQLIKLNKEKRELKEKHEAGVLWPRFTCEYLSNKHGD